MLRSQGIHMVLKREKDLLIADAKLQIEDNPFRKIVLLICKRLFKAEIWKNTVRCGEIDIFADMNMNLKKPHGLLWVGNVGNRVVMWYILVLQLYIMMCIYI